MHYEQNGNRKTTAKETGNRRQGRCDNRPARGRSARGRLQQTTDSARQEICEHQQTTTTGGCYNRPTRTRLHHTTDNRKQEEGNRNADLGGKLPPTTPITDAYMAVDIRDYPAHTQTHTDTHTNPGMTIQSRRRNYSFPLYHGIIF